jgi:hypothetical protein
MGGKQGRGPQHQVKPAASKRVQSESRIAQGPMKATSTWEDSAVAAQVGLAGVEGAARVHGWVGNVRDPSEQPWSGQGVSNKPEAKSRDAQRKSDGAIVPMTDERQNSSRGRGSWEDHAGGTESTGAWPRSLGPIPRTIRCFSLTQAMGSSQGRAEAAFPCAVQQSPPQ